MNGKMKVLSPRFNVWKNDHNEFHAKKQHMRCRIYPTSECCMSSGIEVDDGPDHDWKCDVMHQEIVIEWIFPLREDVRRMM